MNSAPIPGDVNPYAASSFYAVDRYASFKKVWGTFYQSGGLVLTDRYTTSNAVHQAVKCAPEEREAFLRWLDDFEHHKMGLPRPDLVLYLDMPTDRAVSLLRQRESDTHTQADIHELDTGYLSACPLLRHPGRPAARLEGGPLCGRGGPAALHPIHPRGDLVPGRAPFVTLSPPGAASARVPPIY